MAAPTRRGDLRRLVPLAIIAVLLGLGGTAIVQGIGVLKSRPYVDILEMRATKFAYPILLASLASFYAYLLSRRSLRAYLALISVFLLSLVPPGAIIHAVSHKQRDAMKRILGASVTVQPEVAPQESVSIPPALVEWARTSIAQDALIFTDRSEFRTATRRSITGTYKDGGWQYVGGSQPFYAWYIYIRDVERCRDKHGRRCWFELARRYDVDYVLVDPGVVEATPIAEFERAWDHNGWSVWRRQLTATLRSQSVSQ